jgi:hypothetical protein
MTTNKTTTGLLTEMLLNHSWNSTYQEASIAKVLAYLSDGTFFEKIEAEEVSCYNASFKKAYQAWKETNNSNFETVLGNALRILQKRGYQPLVDNFGILAEHGMASEIRNWCYGTSYEFVTPERRIKAIHCISTFAVIERFDGRFCHDHEFDTLDEAIIRAIAVKYDGSNTEANRFICKMLDICDYPQD